jgi:queuine tRNA-ribosyltransferase
MHMTHRWLKRCWKRFNETDPLYGYQQALFPIVQGSVYKDLRRQSAEVIAQYDSVGNAIGGLSVGEPHEDMYEMTDIVTDILPKEKPRYLMGVGTPTNLLECVALGIDMFDCVLPTRNARHGLIYTAEGKINIKNAKWKDDFSPLDPNATNPTSRFYTKAYVRHLFQAKELLGPQITSIHNLSFFLWLMGEARKHIQAGDFLAWKNQMVTKLDRRL